MRANSPRLSYLSVVIQRYLPGGLTEKTLTQRGKIEGERKQVTVMFCDMVGVTRLSDGLGGVAFVQYVS